MPEDPEQASPEPDARPAAESAPGTDAAAGSETKPAPAATEVGAKPEPAEAEAKPEPAASEPEPKRKKKKKKKRKAASEGESAAEAGPREPALDAQGRERPAFVLDFPSHPELDKLVRAFELGNYAYVREHAPDLAEQAEDERVRRAASDLARRIEPDPLVKILLGMSILLFVFLVFYAYRVHGH